MSKQYHICYVTQYVTSSEKKALLCDSFKSIPVTVPSTKCVTMPMPPCIFPNLMVPHTPPSLASKIHLILWYYYNDIYVG